MLTFKHGFAEVVKDYIQPVPDPNYLFNYYYWGNGGVAYSDPLTGDMKYIISNRVAFNSTYKDFANPDYLRSCPDDYSYHVIPFHNNPNKFYLIQFQDYSADLLQQISGLQVRCPNAIGLGYSIGDLSMDSGRGNFTVTNQVIAGPFIKQITTVRHANGSDVWVIVHPYNSDQYSAYLVKDEGIQAPVNTHIGPYVGGGFESSLGTLTASHDGKMLAGVSGVYSGVANQIQLFDFNNATGTVSNYRTLPANDFITKLQFSPDNSKLYFLGYNNLYQFDFNKPDVAGSITKIISQENGSMYDMQLLPDGKIYINHFYAVEPGNYNDYLGAIECPNLPQYACNINYKAIENLPMQFPDLINDFINVPRASPVPKFSLGNDTSICFGSLNLSAPTGWETYKWNTGDTTRSITVKKAGTYYVLTGAKGFSCPEGYGYIHVGDKAIKLNLGNDSMLCPRALYPLHINNDYSNLLWTNGSHTHDSVINQNSYIIISANDKNGCYTRDTISIYYNSQVKADFGPDTTLCNNQKLTLQLYPKPYFNLTQQDYLWSDGTKKDSLVISAPGEYWGQVISQGCTLRDTIKINYIAPANVNLGNDTTVCTGDSLMLRINISNATFKWNTGEVSNKIVVKNTGDYWVRVNNGSCSISDTIQVTFKPKPQFSLGNDTSLCQGTPLLLHVTVPGATYLWQDGSTTDSFNAQNTGTYKVQVTKDGCISGSSISVKFNQLPRVHLGNDTTLCIGSTLFLNVSDTSIKSYIWQDNSTYPYFNIIQAGTYLLSVTGNNGCMKRDSIHVFMKPVPVFSLGNDTILCSGKELNVSANVAGATYLWNNGDNSGAIRITTAGKYWLDVSLNGCTVRDSLVVSFKPSPLLNLGNDTTLCKGTEKLLDASNTGAVYKWQDNSTSAIYHASKAGTYFVSANINGCTATDTIIIQFITTPIFTLGRDTSICLGNMLTLKPLISQVQYFWQDGSSLPYFVVNHPGNYILTATNQCGSSKESVNVFNGICELYVPNAFSPNNDGVNDEFKIKDINFIKTFHMVIYNRFGKIVFTTDNPSIGWDGKFKGAYQPSDIYVYQISLIDLLGIQQNKKGTVMLIR